MNLLLLDTHVFLWWRANDQSNSAGNLLLHLNGNVRQWILGGVGRQANERHRAAEFAARTGPPAATLPDVAEPHLESLVAEVNESSSVSVLDGADVVYVARVPTSRIMTVVISVGTRFPAYATSMGRVLLAGLPENELETYLSNVLLETLTPRTVSSVAALRGELAKVRTQVYALVNQELEDGLRAIAAPVRDRTGRVIAAVNVSAHASRTSLEVMRRDLLPPLLKTAARIEADYFGRGRHRRR